MTDSRVARTASRSVAGMTLFVALAAVAVLAQPLPPSPAQAPPRPQVSPPAQAQPGSAVARRPRAPGRRDPFRSLLVRADQLTQALPPGKPGLLIGQIRLEGIVLTPTDRIAIVTVPNKKPAYFLRERDELFNGYVAEIHKDYVIFKERTFDAFGRPYERQVVKQLRATAGSEQVFRTPSRRQ
ncbi:MAG: hypothetical protein ACE5H2_00530 [Terriglobia bacterium]